MTAFRMAQRLCFVGPESNLRAMTFVKHSLICHTTLWLRASQHRIPTVTGIAGSTRMTKGAALLSGRQGQACKVCEGGGRVKPASYAACPHTPWAECVMFIRRGAHLLAVAGRDPHFTCYITVCPFDGAVQTQNSIQTFEWKRGTRNVLYQVWVRVKYRLIMNGRSLYGKSMACPRSEAKVLLQSRRRKMTDLGRVRPQQDPDFTRLRANSQQEGMG